MGAGERVRHGFTGERWAHGERGIFFFQAEDGIRDVRTCLEFRRVLFRSRISAEIKEGKYNKNRAFWPFWMHELIQWLELDESEKHGVMQPLTQPNERHEDL